MQVNLAQLRYVMKLIEDGETNHQVMWLSLQKWLDKHEAAQQMLAPDLGWVCGKCKTVNDEERTLCGFCDTPRLSG